LRLKAGLDTQTDKQQAVLQTAVLRTERAQWQEAIALTRNQLAALIGKGPDRGQSIARPALPSDEALKLPDDLPLALMGRRPDIVAARWRVEAAQGGIDAAKTQFYPNVNISAFIGSSTLGLQYLLKDSSRIDGIAPAISMPIFEGGRLRAQLKGKVAAYDAAAASLKLAQQRERVGTVNMLQVLGSESIWLTQRKMELDSQARRADLSVALIKALGGGFDVHAQDLDSTKHEQPLAPANPTTPSNQPAEKSAS